MSRILVLILIVGISGVMYAEDSIPEQMLDAVVVKAQRGWIENGIVNVMPSKKEKKLANSPASLIGSMNLPFLREREGEIVRPSGQIVAVFINGERATDIDIATFYTMNVKRVQYIENPSDPRFEGVEAAVNFIMPVYQYGGVTRVNLFQKFIQTAGNGEVASKITYRRMTYGVMVYGNYSKDRGDLAVGETNYRNLFYEGVPYDDICYKEEKRSDRKSDYASIALNAKYSTDKITITHTVAFLRERTPEKYSESSGVWSEDLFGSSTVTSASTSKSLSPQVSGMYFFTFPHSWYLYGAWGYSYDRNSQKSMSQFGTTSPVNNSTDEQVNSCRVVLYPTFIPSERVALNLLIDGTVDYYSTHYSGSTHVSQHQSRKNIITQFRIAWRPNDMLNLRLEPGVNLTLRDIDGNTRKSVNPSAAGSINWNPSRKFNINGRLYYMLQQASPSASNPVMVKNSELIWSLGNPDLKDLISWDASVDATYIPNNIFSISCGLGYSRTDNWIYPYYSPADKLYGGLIRENLSGDPKNHVIGRISLSGNFLNNKLSINLNPIIHYTHYLKPLSANNHVNISFTGDVSYTLGNVRIRASYDSPYCDIDLGGLEYSWRQDYFNFQVTYGTGNFYISARAEDLFHRREKRIERFTTENFGTDYFKYSPGRRFSINVTYTFDYGRNGDRGIDIDGPSSAKTSVAAITY